jgi:GNAT superfamily N-acetyltransferase
MAAPPGLLIKQLTEDHEVRSFRCSNSSVNDFLRNQALANPDTRTYVVTEQRNPFQVIAFYAVYPTPAQLESSVLEEDLDVFSLEYLGTDQRWEGRGIGTILLARQLGHAIYAHQRYGIRGVISYPTHPRMKRWLDDLGFRPISGGGVYLSVEELLDLGLEPLEL